MGPSFFDITKKRLETHLQKEYNSLKIVVSAINRHKNVISDEFRDHLRDAHRHLENAQKMDSIIAEWGKSCHSE